VGDPDRDVVEQDLGAGEQSRTVERHQGRGDGSGHQPDPERCTSWVPGTGPTARRISPAGPLAARPTERSIASAWEPTRKATVGPEPETTPPRAPSS